MEKTNRKIIEGTLCILRVKNNYLLRNETEGINKGCWIFPGGGYERKDSGVRELGVECVVREMQEESGLTPIKPRLKARIFFDNHKRIFPGKDKAADFDYDALYYISNSFYGKFKDMSPDKRRQGWFQYRDTLDLPMHPGDREILRLLERVPIGTVFEGTIMHHGSELKQVSFQNI